MQDTDEPHASSEERRPCKRPRTEEETSKESDVKGVNGSLQSKRSNVQEIDVGIRSYVSSSIPSFNAIIKHRFTDFLVYEIDKDGHICRLKDISKPGVKNSETDALNMAESSSVQLTEHAKAILSSLLDSTCIEKLVELIREFPESRDQQKTVQSEPITTKEQRSQVHHAIREHLPLIETSTTSENAILFRWQDTSSKSAAKRTMRAEMPEFPFITLNLHKTNRETHDCLQYLARQIRVPVKNLGIAGTKDKRAVTVQKVSIRRSRKFLTLEQAWNLVNVSQKSHSSSKSQSKQQQPSRAVRGSRIGDLEYSKQPVALGDLKGNLFRIILRELSHSSKDTAQQALDSLKQRGFLNYYGMQRFGSMSVPTHVIGISILQKNWSRAVHLILEPRDGEDEQVTAGRLAWINERDCSKALRLIPRRYVAETALLEYFRKKSSDEIHFPDALRSIPKHLRMMYVHSYQSFVWNEVVSFRASEFGVDKPVEGDFVMVSDKTPAEVMDQDEDLREDNDADKSQPQEDDLKEDEPGPVVRKVTQTDLQCQTFTIFDVVLPLPGYKVTFPQGQIERKYLDIIEADGIGLDDLKTTSREYSSGGSYRKIMHKPQDLSYHFKYYSDPDATLALTDEDALLGIDHPEISKDNSNDLQENKQDLRLAVQVDITLGSSSYATMALREVMKQDTSSAAHTARSAAIE